MISVVVADDEQLIRAGVRGLLETAGDIKVVAEAGSGSEALRLAHRHQPDVLLLDIHMPDGDGLATAELVGRLCVSLGHSKTLMKLQTTVLFHGSEYLGAMKL